MAKTFFITGTERGVGGTFVTCALLSAAAQAGLQTVAMQPIAVNCQPSETGLQSEGAMALREVITHDLSYERINPFPLQADLPPYLAAEQENKRLTIQRISGICRGNMMTKHEFMLIEGIGGWRNPINHVETLAGLAKELNKPVLLVVDVSPDSLNQAILTADAILQEGLLLAGWIANHTQPINSASQACLNYLTKMIPAPLIATVPFIEDRDWRQAISPDTVKTLLS